MPELDGRRSSGIAKALADMTPEQRAALQQQKGLLQVGGWVGRGGEGQRCDLPVGRSGPAIASKA